MSIVQVKKLHPAAIVPAYKTKGAAGLDLYADGREATTESWRREAHDWTSLFIHPKEAWLLSTGISVAIPIGYEGQVRPRSGWALKHGITVLNSPGTIDADYRGEVKVLLINLGQEKVEIKRGDRIAQLVIAKVEQATLLEVVELDETEREAGGFGSTGKS